VSVLLCVVDSVMGVTVLRDVVYIVCLSSSSIIMFHATTHERLTDINVKGLREPWDIAACELTSHLYVIDYEYCIWRLSSAGLHLLTTVIKREKRYWTKSSSDTFKPWKLSVTSSRVLVTSLDTNELMQLDAAGEQLRRVPLPRYMKYLEHAVESPSGAFVVAHWNTELKQYQVSEVNTEGRVLRQFSRSLSETPHIAATQHIAIDSQGNIFVADEGNRRILLLDARLALRRVIIDEHQLTDRPYRLCYNEQSAQLLVGLHLGDVVSVFDVLER